MPRAVFKFLWEEIQSGREVFAYVNNLAKNGDCYWVFAHVTPSFNAQGEIVGFHSNRRSPYLEALPTIKKLYAKLLSIEQQQTDRAHGLELSYNHLLTSLKDSKKEFNQLVFSLAKETSSLTHGTAYAMA